MTKLKPVDSFHLPTGHMLKARFWTLKTVSEEAWTPLPPRSLVSFFWQQDGTRGALRITLLAHDTEIPPGPHLNPLIPSTFTLHLPRFPFPGTWTSERAIPYFGSPALQLVNNIARHSSHVYGKAITLHIPVCRRCVALPRLYFWTEAHCKLGAVAGVSEVSVCIFQIG